jgi:AraC family transcriptional regulator
VIEARIEILPAKQLVGKCLEMSQSGDRTAELWRSFMPVRSTVLNRIGSHFFSMQVYPESETGQLSPDTRFTKWAVVEVSDADHIPDGMESYSIEGGKYAVFVHSGPASAFPKTMGFIFQNWLPNSEFELDSREHFEVLEEGYSPIDPNATEEIWIPIK